METYALIVHGGKLKAVPGNLLNTYKKHSLLWKTSAKTPEEAEDRFCKYFCPKNERFVADGY